MSERYEANPPMFKNAPLWFVIWVLLIPSGIGIIALLCWYVSCKAKKLVIENGELLWETGILSKSRTELYLNKIRTVKMDQTFGQRIFGTGDLSIFTAGDAPEVIVTGMPEPEKLRRLVKAGQSA